MNWLTKVFTNGFEWIRKNPVIVVLILTVLAYNYFFPHVTPQFEQVNLLDLSSILHVLDTAYSFVLTLQGQTIAWIALITASGVTMFNTGGMFAVFAHKPKPFLEGLRIMLSDRTLEYSALQLIVGVLGAYLLYLELYTLVYIFPHSGLFGVGLVLITILIGYPTSYILLSVGALLAGAKVTVVEKIRYAKLFLRKENLGRLFTFYMIRIGAEVLVVYAAIFIAHIFHVPTLATTVIIILLITLPLAWVRTTGLVLKLNMLKDAEWFTHYFADYYTREIETPKRP